MLNSLLIKNFRIFKELKIHDLKQVNLFVGRNNSGKSCLLEALQIYASKAQPKYLVEITSARDENWREIISENKDNSISEEINQLAYLFHGYHLPEIGGDEIEIGPIENQNKCLKIRRKAYQVIDESDGSRRRMPIDLTSIEDGMLDVQIVLEVTFGDDRFQIPLDRSIDRFAISRFLLPKESSYNFQMVPTCNVRENKLASLWDNINLTELEEEVIKCLQLIDDRIDGIALVGDIEPRYRGRKRIPIVKYKGINERIPLKTMGDGINRLFHIILSLVNAKNGFLLIDEFENGLHWSVHSKLWKTIIDLSDKLNVQVIATTHSRDCVRGFHDIWARNLESASLFRLESDQNKGSRIVNYSYETFTDAIETDVEVR